MLIRIVSQHDIKALLKIYAYYISTPITFEYDLPTEKQFSERVLEISKTYPYLVLEQNKTIIGYAYAHRYMQREAYQWGAELSVYLDPCATSKGYGKKLYSILMAILQKQGVKTVYGCVTLPNAKSEALHRSMGFQPLGIYHNAGFKNCQWHDVIWYEKSIAEYGDSPQPISPISDIPENTLSQFLTGE